MTTFPAPAPRRRLSTGVFSVTDLRHAVLPEELATLAQTFIEQRTAAVLLWGTCSTPARSAIASSNHVEVTLTAALQDWLTPTRHAGFVAVPPSLRRALRCFRAVTLPITTPVLHLGTLVVPAAADSHETTRVLESLAADFALRLEASQRRDILEHLAETDALAGEPSSEARPKLTPTPRSRRSA